MKTFTISHECLAYSTYRREWRANYKTLSQNIREAKMETRTAQKNGSMSAPDMQSGLASLRAQAAFQMEQLAKRKADWKALLASGHEWRTQSAMEAAE